MDSEVPSRYVVPRYRAAGDVAFHHFLHGTVPGHQIDFVYCPEVPQGKLAQTHFGHLARLMKYIEPREGSAHAFALGNLSRDDVQHEPGHGGVAILFALRVAGVKDHAGRDMPPYAHGIVAVDRALEYVTLLEAITVLYRRFLERERAEDRRGDFYRAYVRKVRERPAEVEAFLASAIAEIDDLPQPAPSRLSWDYVAEEPPPRQRITLVHDDGESFTTLAHHAARLGSALYRSNVKWTSITTGREIDIPGGITVRIVPRREAAAEGLADSYEMDDLPESEEELMALLFGARPRLDPLTAPRLGWREKMAAQRPATRSEPPPPERESEPEAEAGAGDDLSVDVELDADEPVHTLSRAEGPDSLPRSRAPSAPPRAAGPRRGRTTRSLFALGALAALAMIAAALAVTAAGPWTTGLLGDASAPASDGAGAGPVAPVAPQAPATPAATGGASPPSVEPPSAPAPSADSTPRAGPPPVTAAPTARPRRSASPAPAPPPPRASDSFDGTFGPAKF